MSNYMVLALSLILVSILILIRLRLRIRQPKLILILFGILLLVMVVFNTYLTIMPIVMYNNSLLLGLKLGTIPIEDFSYLISGVLLIPALFEYFSNEEK